MFTGDVAFAGAEFSDYFKRPLEPFIRIDSDAQLNHIEKRRNTFSNRQMAGYG